MSAKNLNWTPVHEVPEAIQGERRELIEMLMKPSTGAERAGRWWRFTYPDSGGWRTVHEIRQDRINPMEVARILSGEAFTSHAIEHEMLLVLRRLTGGKP